MEPFQKYFKFRKEPDPWYMQGSVPTIKRKHPKIGRNEKCPCGSGKKYKHCCLTSH